MTADLPLREIGKDVWWYVPARIAPALAGFLGLAVYTRLLSPEQYGLYVLIMTTVSIVTSAGFNWLNSANLRYFEEYRQNLSKLLSTSLISLTILFILFSISWYLATILFKTYLSSNIFLLRIGILVLGAQGGFSFILTILRAGRQTQRYGLYSSANALGKVVLAVGLLYFTDLGPEAILVAILIVSGGLACFEIIQAYRSWNIKVSVFSLNLLGKLASYGIPLIGVSFGGQILALADRYMIQYFMDPTEVGIYTAGYSIVNQAMVLLYSVLLTASYPVIIQTFERKGEEEAKILVGKILTLYVVILLPAVFGIVALSKDITRIILGSSFQEAKIVMPWVAIGLFGLGLAELISYTFGLKEKTLYMLYLILGASILNISINLFLIPKFGIVGAAYGTLLSYAAYSTAAWKLGTSVFPWVLQWRSLWKAALASIIMYIGLVFVMPNPTNGFPNLLIKILSGITVYFVLLLLLKEDVCLRYAKFALERL